MSYSSITRYRQPVGDMWSDIDDGLAADCPPSATYTRMIASANELEATWHPSGVYAWNEMADVIAATAKLAGAASSAAITFFGGSSLPRFKESVQAAADKYNYVAKAAVDYTLAWQAAKAAGKPVEAPGFKRWVIDDLRMAAALFREVELRVCMTPWWVGAATKISGFFVDVVNVAKRIVGVVLKVGENAVKAVERTGDIVGFLLRWGPYLALGVGGYYLYDRYVKK